MNKWQVSYLKAKSLLYNIKWSRYRPRVAQRVGRGIALLFHDCGTRRGWVVSSTLRLHFTPGKTRYPLYRRLGGPQGRSGWAENLVPTGIRSRTVQPIVTHYTNWATPPTLYYIINIPKYYKPNTPLNQHGNITKLSKFRDYIFDVPWFQCLLLTVTRIFNRLAQFFMRWCKCYSKWNRAWIL